MTKRKRQPRRACSGASASLSNAPARRVSTACGLPFELIDLVVQAAVEHDQKKYVIEELRMLPKLLRTSRGFRDAVRARATGIYLSHWQGWCDPWAQRTRRPRPQAHIPRVPAAAIPGVHKLEIAHADGEAMEADLAALAAQPDVTQQITSMRLRSLAVGDAPNCLERLPQALPRLQHLAVESAALLPSNFEHIASLPNLASLDLRCCLEDAPDPAQTTALTGLAASLTSLKFDCEVIYHSDDDSDDDEDEEYLDDGDDGADRVCVDYQPLASGLPSLQELEIHRPTQALLGPSLQGTPLASNLRKLQINTTPGYGFDASNMGALSALTQLTYLGLATCERNEEDLEKEDYDRDDEPDRMHARVLNRTLAALRSLRVLQLPDTVELYGKGRRTAAPAGAAPVAPAAAAAAAAVAAPAAAASLGPAFTLLQCTGGLLSPTWARLPLASVQRITTCGDPVAVICHVFNGWPGAVLYDELEEAAWKLAACPGARALSKVIISVCRPDEECMDEDPQPEAVNDPEYQYYVEYDTERIERRMEECRRAVRPLCAELCPHGVRVILNTRLLGADGEYVVDPVTGRMARDGAGERYVSWWSLPCSRYVIAM